MHALSGLLAIIALQWVIYYQWLTGHVDANLLGDFRAFTELDWLLAFHLWARWRIKRTALMSMPRPIDKFVMDHKRGKLDAIHRPLYDDELGRF